MSESVLPWRSGRTFQLWRYGVGHSQLQLLSRGGGEPDTLSVLFEAVEFVKLRRRYTDLVLRIPREDEEVEFAEIASLPVPQLCVVLEGRERVGLVACSRITVRKLDTPDNDSWDDGVVLFSVNRGSASG